MLLKAVSMADLGVFCEGVCPFLWDTRLSFAVCLWKLEYLKKKNSFPVINIKLLSTNNVFKVPEHLILKKISIV